MVMEKAMVTLLVTAIVIAFCLISSSVAAQDSEDSYTSAPPIVLVYENENDGLPIDYYFTHPAIHTDAGNVTLWIYIRMPYQVYNAKLQDTVMWLGGHLTFVSYKASWQNNQTVELYSSSADNGQGQFNFSLTNIPYGDHQLEVDASCIVKILDDYSGNYHLFYDSTGKSLNFTVAPNPNPTPTSSGSTPPSSIEVAVIVIAAIVVVVLVSVSLLVYFKKRKR